MNAIIATKLLRWQVRLQRGHCVLGVRWWVLARLQQSCWRAAFDTALLKRLAPHYKKLTNNSSKQNQLDVATVSEIIVLALSDHVSFDHIRAVHGLSPDQVKALMRSHLSPGGYRAWRNLVF